MQIFYIRVFCDECIIKFLYSTYESCFREKHEQSIFRCMLPHGGQRPFIYFCWELVERHWFLPPSIWRDEHSLADVSSILHFLVYEGYKVKMDVALRSWLMMTQEAHMRFSLAARLYIVCIPCTHLILLHWLWNKDIRLIWW